MRFSLCRFILASAACFGASATFANPFPDADLAKGAAFHDEMCVGCHVERLPGNNGGEIYTRENRRVRSASSLSQQLTSCTTTLDLDLFPEDENDIAGYLNKTYYKFD